MPDFAAQTSASSAPASNRNFGLTLTEMARRAPGRVALRAPGGFGFGQPSYKSMTFAELDEDSDNLARGFQAVGIGPGVRTLFMVKPGIDFLSVAFGLFKAGAIIVGVDPGMGPRNMGRCIEDAQPTAVVGIPLGLWAQKLFGWARDHITTSVVVGAKFSSLDASLTLDEVRKRGAASATSPSGSAGRDSTAAIVFTSGSTGAPKGVVYTHGLFHAQIAALQGCYGIAEGEVDLATFAHFSFFAPALGMSTVFAEMDFVHPANANPAKLIDAVQRFEVSNMFGSPALLKGLGRFGAAEGIRLPSLKRIISAGAVVPPSVIRDLKSMLAPGADVFTPYGATEALPVTSISGEELLAQPPGRHGGVCVGRACRGMDLRVIRIDDEPIERWSDDLVVAPGTVGEIAVRGDCVTRSYQSLPRANALAKIRTADGDVFHRMGDVGYIDDEGRLWFCGRKSQRVTTADGVHFTEPCEEVCNAHPSVLRSALVGVSIEGSVRPVLCVELHRWHSSSQRARLKEELLALLRANPRTRAIDEIVFTGAFPVDTRHNAKISREQLAAVAQRKLA